MKDIDVVFYMDLVAAARKAHATGNFEGAEVLASKAIRMAPHLPSAHIAMGVIKLRQGKWQGAHSELNKAYMMRRGVRSTIANRAFERQPPSSLTISRLRHDLEQLEYLVANGRISKSFQNKTRDLKSLLQMADSVGYAGGGFEVTGTIKEMIKDFYDKAVNLYLPEAIKGGALNPKLRIREIEKAYFAKDRRIVYFDDFLNPKALAQMRRFCLESTFWYDSKAAGYLGAYIDDGFTCGLLFQIAEELKTKFSKIYDNDALRLAWAYKYDSKLSGIGVHADDARVNSNFWLSPNEANLDSQSGGMIVWPCKPPGNWSFRDYNSQESAKETQRFELLKKSKQAPIKVTYRQNRMVIFDSQYLHKTDNLKFKEGYENRRINVTLLYDHKFR